MSERGLPIVDGAPACPFVAFDDDRDERATSPDHRHRCYAEIRPAPRAIAHQEAYCLSSAFPVCPTFQDWARREAARTRDDTPIEPAAVPSDPQRNPPRDWSAPPPWAIGGGPRPDAAEPGAGPLPPPSGPAGPPAGQVSSAEAETPGFLAGRERPEQGLAGSSADRMAGGPRGRAPGPEQPDDEADERADHDEDGEAEPRGRERGGWATTAVGAAAGGGRPRPGQVRPREGDPELRGPTWERPRRHEAYPTIRTRMGLPPIPRVGVMAAALVIAAVALFFLPQLLGLGSNDGVGQPTPSPTANGEASPTASPEPTEAAAPTPQIYIVASGDTMSRIANRFGVPLDVLIAANRETIPNPDRLDIGDEVIIPAPGTGSSPSPGDEASPVP